MIKLPDKTVTMQKIDESSFFARPGPNLQAFRFIGANPIFLTSTYDAKGIVSGTIVNEKIIVNTFKTLFPVRCDLGYLTIYGDYFFLTDAREIYIARPIFDEYGVLKEYIYFPKDTLAICTSGSGSSVVKKLVNYAGPFNRIMVLNTYTAGVTGGSDVSIQSLNLNHLPSLDFGVDKHFNGIGYSPDIEKLRSLGLMDNYTHQQINYNIVVSYKNNKLNVCEYNAEYIGYNSSSSSCEYNKAPITINLKEQIDVNLYPNLRSFVSTGDNGISLLFADNSYNTKYKVMLAVFPGPVILVININGIDNSVHGAFSGKYFIKNNYLYGLFYDDQAPYTAITLYKSIDKISTSINVAQLSTPRSPNPINQLDTRRFY